MLVQLRGSLETVFDPLPRRFLEAAGFAYVVWSSSSPEISSSTRRENEVKTSSSAELSGSSTGYEDEVRASSSAHWILHQHCSYRNAQLLLPTTEVFLHQIRLCRDQFEDWPIQVSYEKHRNTACRTHTHWDYESDCILVSDHRLECHKHVRVS